MCGTAPILVAFSIWKTITLMGHHVTRLKKRMALLGSIEIARSLDDLRALAFRGWAQNMAAGRSGCHAIAKEPNVILMMMDTRRG